MSACGRKPDAIAELTAAQGTVEREQGGEEAWKPAKVGARYFLGDAARTWNGTATLEVGGGAARIVMQSLTVLRFGGKAGTNKISVEAGAIDLTGTGEYALDIGDVKLPKGGTVRISAHNGSSSIELTLGPGAQLASSSGVIDLATGVPVELTKAGPVDAGVPDARVAIDAAVPDAPDVVETSDATIEVTGKRADVQLAGETAWKPLPAGASPLAKGSKVRLGAGTTAKVTAATTSLELAGGARIVIGDDLGFAVEAGGVRAQASAPASVALPGGALALTAAGGASEARVDAGPRETKVTQTRGGSKLTGAPGAELAMNRGESATLTRAGAIRVVESIPSYFDFRVTVGESLTIHDPRPPTSVQFQFDGKCPDGGIIEVDRDNRFRTAKVSGGKDFANVLIPVGSFAYRLRCTRNGDEGGAVASGRVTTQRDDGRRPLPKSPGTNDIDADGRNYRISYQSTIPSVAVHVKNPGSAHRLHLASGGKEQTFDSSSATITVPGAQLHEGTYSYWVDRDGQKQDKVSNLTIDFDQTAPQVYIESPANGQPWTGDLDVRGAVLPGWSAAVGEITIPVDRQRRFSAKVGTPAGSALAIRLSHPQRGIHYYLRRSK